MCNEAIKSGTMDDKKEMVGLSLVDPFRALLVHFGMLLGVDDFETIDSYHRGKMWLHNAWLHRGGAVWGLRTSLSEEKGEIRVCPGLAIDGLGREMFLEKPECLNLGQWYDKHKDDPAVSGVVTAGEDGSVVFDGHVAMRFKGCLAREVPALSEPCEGSGAVTAYSRVIETAELLLLPGKAPERGETSGELPYGRLRALFGLENPESDETGETDSTDGNPEIRKERAQILALPASERCAAFLEAFQCLSALDEMDLVPSLAEDGETYSLFPERHENALLPLANIEGITLTPAENGWGVSGGKVDNSVRTVILPTETIQELLCGPGCCNAMEPDDVGGPRVKTDSVKLNDKKIVFEIVRSELLEKSASANGVSVTSFDEVNGWKEHEIEAVICNKEDDKFEVVVTLADDPGNLVRLVVKGTGKFPFLGTGRIPLAGAVGGPPGSETDGNDFVCMITRS